MKKSIVLMDLALFLFALTGFFYFLIGNGYYMLILSIFPISLYVFSAVVKMDKENYTWVVFILFMWISALVSRYTTACYKFMLVVVILFLAKLIFESVYGWHKKMSKLFYAFATIHTVAVLLCLVIPSTIRNIANTLYTGETLDAYELLFESQAYAGITGQTAFAAFFASIFLAYGICGVLCENKKGWNVIAIILGFIALFLTVKRSYIIANIIAIVAIFYIHNKSNRKIVNNLFMYIGVTIVGYYVLSHIPEVRNVFLKTDILRDSNDITNGRIDLWMKTIELWKESPVFGLGISTLPLHYGISTHNVYLQVLAETGIFGFASYITVVITSFVKSCRIYEDIKKDTQLPGSEKTIFSVCIYMQIIYMVYCFTGNSLYGISFLLIYMFSIACIKSYKHEKN